MSEKLLYFRLEGQDPQEAQKAADLFAETFEAQFGTRPRPVPASQANQVKVRGTDPATVTMIVLAIPPAILATIDLAQRLKVVEGVKILLAKAKEIREQTNHGVLLVAANGDAVVLDQQENPDRVIELANQPHNAD